MLIVQPWVEKVDFNVSRDKALEFVKTRTVKKQPVLSHEEREELKKYIASLEARFKNKQFLAKAPQAVIEKERERLEEAKVSLKA